MTLWDRFLAGNVFDPRGETFAEPIKILSSEDDFLFRFMGSVDSGMHGRAGLLCEARPNLRLGDSAAGEDMKGTRFLICPRSNMGGLKSILAGEKASDTLLRQDGNVERLHNEGVENGKGDSSTGEFRSAGVIFCALWSPSMARSL
jgi:hypothetical protein